MPDGLVTRRALRRPLRSGARSLAAAIPPDAIPPLPSTAVEYWHSEIGSSVQKTVGQIRGTTLLGTNAPTLASDPGFFNERKVFQTSVTGGKCWLGTNLGIVVNGSTRPWYYVVGRWRTGTASALQTMASIGRTTTAADGNLSRTAANIQQVWASSGSFTVTDGAADTNVHRFKTWIVGSASNLTVDETNSTGTGSPLGGNINGVAIGCSGGSPANGPIEPGDCSVAFFLVCSALPPQAEIDALDAWAVRYYSLHIPPLPSSAVEYFMGDQAASASLAIGLKAGTQVQSQNSPTVGTDPGYFNGKKVYLSGKTAQACWVTTLSPRALIPAGSQPWVFIICRVRAQQQLSIIGGFGAVDDSKRIYLQVSFGSTFDSINGNYGIGGPAADPNPHRFKIWAAGAVGNFMVGDNLYTGNGESITTNYGTANIGGLTAGPFFADASIPFMLICSAKPSAAEETALDNWAKSYYGVP